MGNFSAEILGRALRVEDRLDWHDWPKTNRFADDSVCFMHMERIPMVRAARAGPAVEKLQNRPTHPRQFS